MIKDLEKAIISFIKLMPHKEFTKEPVMLAYESMFARLQELKLKETKGDN